MGDDEHGGQCAWRDGTHGEMLYGGIMHGDDEHVGVAHGGTMHMV